MTDQDKPYPLHQEAATEPADYSSRSLGGLLSLLLTLLVGLGLTVLMFRYFVEMDRERITTRLQQASENFAAISAEPFMSDGIQLMRDTLFEIQAAGESAVSSQQALDDWLWDPGPMLENTHLEYLPRVSHDRAVALGAFPRPGEGEPRLRLLREGGNGAPVQPAAEYFPVMLETAPEEPRAVIGTDRSSDALIRLAMRQARDTGRLSTVSFNPMEREGGPVQEIITRHFVALYEGGGVPEGLAERREKLTGFISAAGYFPAEAFIAFIPDEMQGIQSAYFVRSQTQPDDIADPVLEEAARAGRLALTDYSRNDPSRTEPVPMQVVTRALPELLATSATPRRWWALAIGLLLTAWVCGMILWARRQALTMARVIQQRTHDLSERSRSLGEANRALTESEARYRMLADNASDVIYTHDLDGICTYISPSIRQLDGHDAQAHLGQPISARMDEESKRKVEDMLAQARREVAEGIASPTSRHVLELAIDCADGGKKYLENTVSFLFADGSPSGLLGVSRDISDRKRAEQEREKLEAAYRQAQKMEAVGTLAGGVAHDFNNLLTGILGYADLLKLQFPDNAKAREGLEVIEKAGLRAKELTSQLLGFARKGQYRKVPVDLNQELSDVMSLLERTLDKNIEIKRYLSKEPPCLEGDPGQISQVLLNLAVNARDAMPKGGTLSFETAVVEMENSDCRIHPELSPGRYSVISVSDTGVGIAPDKLGRIFEPFFTDKKNGKGTGMGLAMAYGVARSHDGTVTVYSEEGQGSIFKVYLPYQAHLAEAGEPAAAPEATLRELPRGSGTVLVVDDEAVVRGMAGAMLEELGYRVEFANDGAQALDRYASRWRDIDLVILDMIMPRMGGLECLKGLRSINPEVKAVLATGYSREVMAGQLNQMEIHGFLQKPFRLREAAELLHAVLTRQQAGGRSTLQA